MPKVYNVAIIKLFKCDVFQFSFIQITLDIGEWMNILLKYCLILVLSCIKIMLPIIFKKTYNKITQKPKGIFWLVDNEV